jgi:transposase
MARHREAFVAFDMAKLRNAVAVADTGRYGEIRYPGEIGTPLKKISPKMRPEPANRFGGRR